MKTVKVRRIKKASHVQKRDLELLKADLVSDGYTFCIDPYNCHEYLVDIDGETSVAVGPSEGESVICYEPHFPAINLDDCNVIYREA